MRINLYILSLFLWLWSGCSTEQIVPSKTIVQFQDSSDTSIAVYSPPRVLASFGLDRNIWQARCFISRDIADVDYGPRYEYYLPQAEELTSNIFQRRQEVERFSNAVFHHAQPIERALNHSVIWSPLMQEIEYFYHNDSSDVLEFRMNSNLIESGDWVYLYDDGVIEALQNDPESIVSLFKERMPIYINFHNREVHFIVEYRAKNSVENKRVRLVYTKIYQPLLSQLGIACRIVGAPSGSYGTDPGVTQFQPSRSSTSDPKIGQP